MEDLENLVDQPKKESWIKKAFKEEWPTMPNHLAACVVAIGAASGFSHIADRFTDSDAIISSAATLIDMTSYWGAFLPQLIYRDRNKLKNDEGKLDRKKVLKKAGEYLGYIGIIEGTYSVLRFGAQYFLQKKGMDPGTASLTVMGVATGFFTVAWPPIRYATKQWSER